MLNQAKTLFLNLMKLNAVQNILFFKWHLAYLLKSNRQAKDKIIKKKNSKKVYY